MDKYLCFECGNTWEARVERYLDWYRRQCPRCRRRTTVKKELFEHAVEEYARSLEESPPPRSPQASAVIAVLKLLADTFPRSSPVKVYQIIDKTARQRMKAKGKASG